MERQNKFFLQEHPNWGASNTAFEYSILISDESRGDDTFPKINILSKEVTWPKIISWHFPKIDTSGVVSRLSWGH